MAERSAVEAGANARRAPLAARADDAASLQQQLDADAQLPRRQWLNAIRAHQQAGNEDLARASLERYLSQHPGARLPDDLRALLEQ